MFAWDFVWWRIWHYLHIYIYICICVCTHANPYLSCIQVCADTRAQQQLQHSSTAQRCQLALSLWTSQDPAVHSTATGEALHHSTAQPACSLFCAGHGPAAHSRATGAALHHSKAPVGGKEKEEGGRAGGQLEGGTNQLARCVCVCVCVKIRIFECIYAYLKGKETSSNPASTHLGHWPPPQ